MTVYDDVSEEFTFTDHSTTTSNGNTTVFATEHTINVPAGEVWYIDRLLGRGKGYSSDVDSAGTDCDREHRIVLTINAGTNVELEYKLNVVDVRTQNNYNTTEDGKAISVGEYVSGDHVDSLTFHHEIYVSDDYSGTWYSENFEGGIEIRRVE